MIFVYPHNADWDHIADVDRRLDAGRRARCAATSSGWRDCRHRPFYRWLAALRHQSDATRLAGLAADGDRDSARGAHRPTAPARRHRGGGRGVPRRAQSAALRWFLRGCSIRTTGASSSDNAFGIRYLPLTTDHHRRFGTRERLLDVAKRFPGLLTISLDTLATRVLARRQPARLSGRVSARARGYIGRMSRPIAGLANRATVYASREVILCGGAFNSPQLLMLSGIGPPEVLREHRIPERVALPGVGRNLQDRYEVSVVSQMDFPEWDILQGGDVSAPAIAAYVKWQTRRRGLYATNGSVLTVFTRSTLAGALPDLFCMALVARFDGYKPGYSASLGTDKNFLTWVILKAHTKNAAGEITLRSADPLEPPISASISSPKGVSTTFRRS